VLKHLLAALALAPCAACHYDGQTSAKFTEATFLAVPSGSSQSEAIALLGEPVGRWRASRSGLGDVEVLSFRDQDNGFGTWHAVLEFAPSGHLVARDLDLRDDDH
jgi:hypothetical protein